MNKDEFKVIAAKTIDDVSEKIDHLKTKKDSAQGELLLKYESSLKDIEGKGAELKVQYAELENASEQKWDEVKKAFTSASDSFKEGFVKISSLF